MKRLLSLCLLVCSFLWGDAQVVVQRAGAANTVNDPRHMASLNAYLPTYADTAEANLPAHKGIDSSGALIYTYDVKAFWLRQHHPKRWVRLVDAGNIAAYIEAHNNGTTIVNDSTLIVCATTGACDTLTVHTTVQNISLTERLSDSTLRVCNASGVCDTLTIPRPRLYSFRNGLDTSYGAALVELGGTLLHGTLINTDHYTLTVAGTPYGGYPLHAQQKQNPLGSPGIAAFQNGFEDNPVMLGVHYTTDTSGLYHGHLGDKMGYFLATNLGGLGNIATGPVGQSLMLQKTTAKVSGLFLHTEDSLYTDAVTLFGQRAHGSIVTDRLDTTRILTAHTNRNLTFYGYPSSRNDGVLTKVLGTDASGNVLLGTVAGGSGDYNFAHHDLTATGNRVHDFSSYGFRLNKGTSNYLDYQSRLTGDGGTTFTLNTRGTQYSGNLWLASDYYEVFQSKNGSAGAYLQDQRWMNYTSGGGGFSQQRSVNGSRTSGYTLRTGPTADVAYTLVERYDNTTGNHKMANLRLDSVGVHLLVNALTDGSEFSPLYGLHLDHHSFQVRLDALKTGGTAPAQSGVVHLVTVDGDGRLSFVKTPPTYADNAAALAAGRSVGEVYMTADGGLKIVYAP